MLTNDSLFQQLGYLNEKDKLTSEKDQLKFYYCLLSSEALDNVNIDLIPRVVTKEDTDIKKYFGENTPPDSTPYIKLR